MLSRDRRGDARCRVVSPTLVENDSGAGSASEKREGPERVPLWVYRRMNAKLIDPIITFGKYKLQKLRLSQLPDDYLKWLAIGRKNEGAIRHRGYNWDRLAQLEIERRAKGASPGVMYDFTKDNLGDILDAESEDTDLPDYDKPEIAVRPERPSPSNPLAINIQSMDVVATHLLREFITRRDKTQTLSVFTTHLAKEALRYGKPLPRHNEDPKEHWYYYHGFSFCFVWEPSLRTHGIAAIVPGEQTA